MSKAAMQLCRSPNCVAIRAQKAVMLFDCGEDSQRQLLKQPQIVHGKINRIFVTDLGSTNIYGIPGKQHFLVCWNNMLYLHCSLLLEVV